MPRSSSQASRLRGTDVLEHVAALKAATGAAPPGWVPAPGRAAPDGVYGMCMALERVQILLTTDQRRRLEDEAREQGTSVAALVRDAVDARYGSVTRERRIAAVDAIAGMHGEFVPPEELERIVDEERDEALPEHRSPA
jgi:hypothetical protein